MSRFLASTALVLTLARLAEGGAESQPLRLDEVIAAAEAANPTIVAARARTRAAAAMPARVSAWDDPTVSWESWNFPDSFRLDHADNNIIRLSQKIPFPGKRGLAGAVLRHRQVPGGRASSPTFFAPLRCSRSSTPSTSS